MGKEGWFQSMMGLLAVVVWWLIPTGAGAWPMPDTGQTQSYAAGDDGAYTLNPRSYTVNDDGTVTDNVTKLVWQRQDDGQTRNRTSANNYCESLALGGFTDWRVPTAKEMATVIDFFKGSPSIDGTVFPGTQQSWYWSSTPYPHSTDNTSTWMVNFQYGAIEADPLSGYVRCVRTGLLSWSSDPLVINNRATATDVTTGMSWQRQDGGKKSWLDAITYCEGLTLDGFNDWRLPAITELHSLTSEYRVGDPVIARTDSVYWYWSSTSRPSTSYGFTILGGHLSGGFSPSGSGTGTGTSGVRCVRSGPVNGAFGALTLVSPPQAATVIPGTTLSMAWDPKGLAGQVAISLSRQGGKEGTWETIAASTDNDGQFDWVVNGPGSVNCMLKIEPLDAPDMVGYQGLFSISTLQTLTLTAAARTKFTIYNLTLEEHYSNGVVQPLNPAVASWTLSDPTIATLTASTLTALQNGWVTVTAEYQGATDSQALLLVDPAQPDDSEAEPNNDEASADLLPAAEVWQGEALSGDSDLFQIDVAQAALIRAGYVSTSSTADVRIEVVDSSGEVVATVTSTNGANQTLSCGLPAGTHYLWVQPSGDIDQNATYLLSWQVETFTSPVGDLPLSNGGSQQATLYGLSDTRALPFSATTGQAFTLHFTSTSPIADYTLTLRDNAGDPINSWTSTNGAPVTIATTLATGNYSLLVSQNSDVDAAAPFTVTMANAEAATETEPNPNGATATPLGPDAPLQAMLPLADTDFYSFSLAQPALIQLGVNSTSESADYRLTLYKDSEAYPIDGTFSQDGQESSLSVGLLAGDYLVKIEPTGDIDQDAVYTLTLGSTSTPGLEVEPNDTLETANGLDKTVSRQGRIYSAEEIDLYGYTLATATSYTITFTPAAGTSADYALDIINEAGTVLATKTSVDGATTTFTLKPKAPGTFYLHVKASGDVDPYATYSVSMTTSAQVTAVIRLAGLSVSADTTTLAVHQTLPLTVQAVYSDASTMIKTSADGVSFVSSDPSVLTVDASGRITGVKDGHATVTVAFQGKSQALNLTVGSPQTVVKQGHGNLLIVAGGTMQESDTLKQATIHISELAYQKFQARSFMDEDIYFMTQTAFHDLNGDGYDDRIVDDLTPTASEITTVVTDWAKNQASDGPLYVFLADHGANQKFQVAGGDQILNADQLNAALDTFQAATGRSVVVIIEACYSGSFVAPLTSSTYDRLILTSVDAKNPGYLSSDGSISFSAFLLAHLFKGKNINDSLALTKAELAGIGRPYSGMAPQFEEGKRLKSLKVGGDFVLAGVFPEISATTASQTITAGSTLPLTATATALMGGLKVWAVIVPPNYTPPTVTSGEFISPADQLPTIPLEDEDLTTKVLDSVFVGSYADLTYNGVYSVTFYARDSENNLAKSAPVSITVTNGLEVQTTGAPAAIEVPARDADGNFTVRWSGSADQGASYVLQEATDIGFSTGLQTVYSGTVPNATITGRGNANTYFYRVKATKATFTDSAWLSGGNGCRVTFLTGAPASITVPLKNAQGSYQVRWGASPTEGVSYLLQEATNSTFTAGLRQVYSGPDLSAGVTERSQGTTYYYRVKALKTAYTTSGWTVATNSCAVPGTLSVMAPASITAPKNDENGDYQVKWVASSTSAPPGVSVTYVVQEATDNTFTTGLRTVYSGPALSADITGRALSNVYTYRVKAMANGYRESGWRVSWSCAVPGSAAGTPAFITVPTKNAVGNFTVRWGASATSGATYLLEEATNSTFTAGLRTVYSGPALFAPITGLAPLTTYYYRVRAMSKGWTNSGWRMGGGCAVPGTPAGKPADITVPASNEVGDFTVSWGRSTSSGVTYLLEEATDSGFTTRLRTVYMGPDLSAAITGRLLSPAVYYYRVKAIGSGHVDSIWQVSSGCAVPGTTVGPPPTISVPARGTESGFWVKWGASTTSDVTYVLEEATDIAFTSNLVTARSGKRLSFLLSGRTPGSTYYYRVKAMRDGYITSSWLVGSRGCTISP